ncbi:2'-5' RNA ligase family protein [Gottfriedia sp. NPDC057948]|uniref:2'-5' RNA ligase family protein n=1 Tax=Gottfriedia sp. NPDC057948 TaxID=3346287 RepID=UPI0036DC6C33
MQYFIGIVTPDEYLEKIIRFQHQWGNNVLTNVVEPHITIKAQGGLTSDESWLIQVMKVCEDFPPFEVTLDKPMFFGESVLFLSIESTEIRTLHNKLIQAISPSEDLIKKYLELENYVPHLTLGQSNYGLTVQELDEMAKRVEKELIPYPTFKVNILRVYQEIEPNKYIKYMDIPLKKQS